ncbi:MAG: hypothetical protein WA906_12895 [Pacificimonas sp.]
MTREQMKGADPKVASAFIAFAQKLGAKARVMSGRAADPKDVVAMQNELIADTCQFLKAHKTRKKD